MTALSLVAGRAADLRNAFDRARAVPFSASASEQSVNLLAIGVSQDAYALRVDEISGLVTDRIIVAFPTPIPELLGVASIRGTLVPVYSLAALLGYAAEPEGTRWLALCGKEEPVALAFGEFDGFLSVAPTQLYTAGKKDATRGHVEHMVRAANTVRAVVSIPLLREAIQKQCGNKPISKER